MIEELFKDKWIETKTHAFLLGFICVFIGTFSAYFIMPRYLGIMSVAFTSLVLTHSLSRLIVLEENKEIRENKFSFKQLFKDHKDIFKVYFLLFLGIFFAYFIIGALLHSNSTQFYFSEQLRLTGLFGNATETQMFFVSILANNIAVLIACFLLSFFYGAGSIIYLTLNASVWGVFFGYVFSGPNPDVFSMLKLFLSILPHTLAEALSYIFIVIAGAVLSAGVIREKFGTQKFLHVLTDALIFLGIAFVMVIIAAAIEVF